jgi:starvation-inducible DNA-binding protein
MDNTHIGLDEKERFGSADILNRLLSDEFLLYTKTRNYHWNVTGPRFHPLHLFFETQYEQLDEIMDSVAERVRAMGFYAFGTMEQFKKMARIQEGIGDIPDEDGMLRSLLNDHETIIRHIREDLDKDDKVFHDAGTTDFVTSIMEEHEKMAWMLRSHFGK